jgi:chromosome segregation ATPase
MNRELLEKLGLEKEVIEQVMTAHGKAIQELKPAQEELEGLKTEKSTLEQQLTDLQKTLTTKEEEYSTYEGNLDELKKEVETYKLKDLKTSIAVQAGIPLELAGRLSGATEEEIKSDAEKISGFVNKKQPLPLKTTEPQNVDEKEQAYKSLVENLNLEGE